MVTFFFFIFFIIFELTKENTPSPLFNITSKSVSSQCDEGYFSFILKGTIYQSCDETEFELPLGEPVGAKAKCILGQENVPTTGTETHVEINCKLDAVVTKLDQATIKLDTYAPKIKDDKIIFTETEWSTMITNDPNKEIIAEKVTCASLSETIIFTSSNLSLVSQPCDNKIDFNMMGKLSVVSGELKFYLSLQEPKMTKAFCQLGASSNISISTLARCQVINDNYTSYIIDSKVKDKKENIVNTVKIDKQKVRDISNDKEIIKFELGDKNSISFQCEKSNILKNNNLFLWIYIIIYFLFF